jgi:hypothetical protein
MFDDSLNKDELEEFLNSSDNDIDKIFKKYNLHISKIISKQ